MVRGVMRGMNGGQLDATKPVETDDYSLLLIGRRHA